MNPSVSVDKKIHDKRVEDIIRKILVDVLVMVYGEGVTLDEEKYEKNLGKKLELPNPYLCDLNMEKCMEGPVRTLKGRYIIILLAYL